MATRKNNIQAIPVQHSGSQVDVVEKKCCSSLAEAKALFDHACNRLLQVNEWARYAGISAFQLFGTNGIRAERKAQSADFIRIDIPGPGSHAGKGYDWVKIEEIELVESDDYQKILMRVRPCEHPLSDRSEIAHFLKKDATSTFIVQRAGLWLSAEEHGRNEMPNLTVTSLYDKGRNFLVGMAAKLGFAYPQWKSLVKALLDA